METKYVQTIDELGRVILPKAFREKHGWAEGSTIAMHEMEGLEGSLVLSPVGNAADCVED